MLNPMHRNRIIVFVGTLIASIFLLATIFVLIIQHVEDRERSVEQANSRLAEILVNITPTLVLETTDDVNFARTTECYPRSSNQVANECFAITLGLNMDEDEADVVQEQMKGNTSVEWSPQLNDLYLAGSLHKDRYDYEVSLSTDEDHQELRIVEVPTSD